MDRNLVQVKQRRSFPADGTCIVRRVAELAAHPSMGSAIARLLPEPGRTWRMGLNASHAGQIELRFRAGAASVPAWQHGSDPIAGLTKPVRPTCVAAMADALRDRLHARPLVLRATSNTDLRRSFTR